MAVSQIIALGFGLGVALGVTGIGAGALLTPALVLFGVHPLNAVGTSLVFSVVTKLAGGVQHIRQGTSDLRAVRWMAVGSVPAAVLSVVIVRTVVRRASLDVFTQRAIAAALLLVAVLMTLRFLNRLPSRTDQAPRTALVALGASVGAMVALTSVGSGSLAIVALGLLTPLAAVSLVGTDMVHAALVSLVIAPAFLIEGTVDIGLALGLAMGSVPGVLLGSRLAALLPEKVTRGAVLLAVWAVALKLV